MSVLIEALTLVVPKKVLEVSYPGGSAAFLEKLLHLERPPRFICSVDQHLVNASFYDPKHIAPATSLLTEQGIIEVDDRRFIEFAIVDQRFGPTMPCNWLELQQHSGGLTHAWLSGTGCGDMAAPEGWTQEQSRSLTRTDIRNERGRSMQLAEDDGLETWIDFVTGELIQGLPQRDAAGSSAGESVQASVVGTGDEDLLSIVKGVLDERGWPYDHFLECTVSVSADDAHIDYHIFLTTDEKQRTICCECHFTEFVPETRRLAVAEAITRANWSLTLGGFSLDFSDGEMLFRIGIDVEGGLLVPLMVHNMIATSVSSARRYHDALMAVAFEGAEPAAAIRQETRGRAD